MYIKNPPRVFLNSKTDWFYILFVFCCTDSHKVDERWNHTCLPSRLAREAPDILARLPHELSPPASTHASQILSKIQSPSLLTRLEQLIDRLFLAIVVLLYRVTRAFS